MPIKKILILNRFRFIDSFCLFVYLFIFFGTMEKRKGNRNSLGGKIEMWPRKGLLYIFRLGF